MTKQDTPTTLSRAQYQIDMIRNAETEDRASISWNICTGYLLALFFEGLIDNIEHTELENAAERAKAQWLPPMERERAE